MANQRHIGLGHIKYWLLLPQDKRQYRPLLAEPRLKQSLASLWFLSPNHRAWLRYLEADTFLEQQRILSFVGSWEAHLVGRYLGGNLNTLETQHSHVARSGETMAVSGQAGVVCPGSHVNTDHVTRGQCCRTPGPRHPPHPVICAGSAGHCCNNDMESQI